MSGLEVIGSISAIIGIIDASIKIYKGMRQDKKLSDNFKVVGARLPILLDSLQTCRNHLEPAKDRLPADVCKSLEQVLDDCDEKASKLRQIFEKVIPGEDDASEKRYLKLIRRFGKGNKVEELMASITKDVQLIVNNHAIKSASPNQNNQLARVIQEMESLKSDTPDESSGFQFNSGGGAQTNNVNSGSGQQINNNAAVGTQNFGKY
ncbi:hypothetical protein AbraIFM66951_011596 [Aspergillus brasiliensis]|uniref:NACHT-NTPase and P-loop NTPases N-terminal domain-containing protein n=1 Tax=Aspergillus brasiliensis TaxID=319629 RepID=A0A9W5YRH8_9EURO|nr:hypothetical protein AbraCBS73388_006870 [Aspergillus brasiliensis]GKZ33931.1 hypothetical protein AbraIFM66950_004022 [Aspergillus brasiliensis]GKZ41852.1 hypothetical protein AbraIFM66951_011596 [Aspergillus brasiliensis]